MKGSENELVSIVRRSARRRRLVEAAALGLRLAAAACALAALLAVAVRLGAPGLRSPWVLGPVAAVVLAGLAAVLLRALRPVHEVIEAKRLDDALGLKDRFASALSFLAQPGRTPFEEAAVLDARRHLGEAKASRRIGVSLRRPALSLLAASLFAVLVVGAVQLAEILHGRSAGTAARAVSTKSPDRPEAPERTAKVPDAAKPPASDNGLVAVEDMKLKEDESKSTLTDAQLRELKAMAGETGEADRLLAQAAYLDESDLADDGRPKSRRDERDTVSMKEPDMDAIKEMVGEAQKRKKEGKDQEESRDDINLEVLIKSHASSSAKPPEKRPDGQTPAGGGEGTSQDTRIQPRRVPVDAKVEFRIVSVRSLTPPGSSDEKRIVLSEAVMRTSGAPVPPLVETKPLGVRETRAESGPLFAQGVPAALRAYISKYFEGLRELEKAQP
jgi:hypothetical protein